MLNCRVIVNKFSIRNYLPESVNAVVDLIAAESNPAKIILFGSGARESHRANSDFDLAVMGKACSEDEWTRLVLNVSESEKSLYTIDLVEFEKLSAEYQSRIEQDGKIIYESSHKF